MAKVAIDGAAPPEPTWTLGDRLAKARRVGGFVSQQALADVMGIGRRSIERYEGDKAVPTPALLVAWAHFTNVPLDWLLGTEQPPDPDPPLTITGPKASRGQRKRASAWMYVPALGDAA